MLYAWMEPDGPTVESDGQLPLSFRLVPGRKSPSLVGMSQPIPAGPERLAVAQAMMTRFALRVMEHRESRLEHDPCKGCNGRAVVWVQDRKRPLAQVGICRR